ncbi:MAG TPA: acetylornithine/succinylornithine family transaminase [Gemmatimonadaceae bacterium]|nr:acetylornithine/succinylornithine family transaminase [Gemmatimonadaceae bacterium]
MPETAAGAGGKAAGTAPGAGTARTERDATRTGRTERTMEQAVMAAVDLPPDTGAPVEALLPIYKRPAVELVRGEGVELFDDAGRAYLDFVSGIAVNALGYGDAALADAMRAAMESGVLHTSNLYHTAPARELAEALVSRSFADRAFFCNSGAEANEAAFKFARRWAATASGSRAKHEIIALRGSFHGRLFASLAATDRPAYRAPFRPLAGGVSIMERDLEELRAALDPETVAAVIVEPVQGEGGVRVLDERFLRGLRALTRERRIALIFDEVQCGLGRTGWLFAHQRLGIEPDMMTLAKPLAGGLPMGAVLLSEEIAAAIKPGDHATTFGGGPFVASVARHVVERLADAALLERVRENGAWLGETLAALAARQPKVRAVRGIGYIWGVDVAEPAAGVVARALELGLLVCTAGEYTLRLLPPLVATREDLARGVALLEEALS